MLVSTEAPCIGNQHSYLKSAVRLESSTLIGSFMAEQALHSRPSDYSCGLAYSSENPVPPSHHASPSFALKQTLHLPCFASSQLDGKLSLSWQMLGQNELQPAVNHASYLLVGHLMVTPAVAVKSSQHGSLWRLQPAHCLSTI